MKKTIITLIALLFAVTTTFAQQKSEPRVPSGYQGFIDMNNLYTFSKDINNSIGMSTTHGFYFNPKAYIGLGMGFETDNDYVLVPIYAAIHYNFNYSKPVSPIMRLRLGSYVGDGFGTYADLALGVRFASKRDFAVSIMVAGTFFEGFDREVYGEYQDQNGYWYYDVISTQTVQPSGVGLRIGIEW